MYHTFFREGSEIKWRRCETFLFRRAAGEENFAQMPPNSHFPSIFQVGSVCVPTLRSAEEPMIVRTSGGLWGPPMSFYCHLQAQLLLTGYKQPGRDVSGSHNGRIGARTSPLDGPMRYREVPTKFPFTGVLCGRRVRRVSRVDRRAAAAYGDANML